MVTEWLDGADWCVQVLDRFRLRCRLAVCIFLHRGVCSQPKHLTATAHVLHDLKIMLRD